MLRLAPFVGTRRDVPSHAKPGAAVALDTPITVTLHLKRRTPDRLKPGSAEDLDRLRAKRYSVETLAAERTRTHRRAADRIVSFAQANGLTVDGIDLMGRTVRLSGSAAMMKTLFNADLAIYRADGKEFRSRIGELTIPKVIAPWTRAIVGFDRRPLRAGDGAPSATADGLWPHDIAKLYGLPVDPLQAPCSIGIVALGGGYQISDAASAMNATGLPMPTVIDVSVNGAVNQFGQDARADRELALDIQVVAGALPQARIVIYFAPNDRQGLINAVQQAITDKQNRPSVVSASWGSAELFWTPAAIDAMQAALADAVRLGVTVLFASGDGLALADAGDGEAHVWYPASSVYAIGVGGTTVTLDSTATRIVDEVVWNDGDIGSGGGISVEFPVPVYQSQIALPTSITGGHAGRGVPDVSALAARQYRLVVGGNSLTESGTSAATPLWATIIARINAARAQPIGLALPALYSHPAALRTITKGDNRMHGGIGYAAGSGWSACTGLGVPIGADLIAALRQDEMV